MRPYLKSKLKQKGQGDGTEFKPTKQHNDKRKMLCPGKEKEPIQTWKIYPDRHHPACSHCSPIRTTATTSRGTRKARGSGL
jgi:hypothetical protein